MQLNRLADQVLHYRLRSRGRHVGPADELAVGYRLAVLAHALFLLRRRSLRLVYRVALCLCRQRRVLLRRGERCERYRVAVRLLSLLRLPLSLLRGFRLLAYGFCRHVARPYDVVIAHACHAPCERRRQQNATEEELRSEDAPSVHEEVGEINLQSVVERRARGDEEVERRLPSAQPLLLQYQLA